MNLLAALIIILFATSTTKPYAQSLQKTWSSCYSDSTVSFGTADMVTDKNGNTYTVGYRIYNRADYYDTHLYLLKVNATGVQEWIRFFSTEMDPIDNAKAVAVDAQGNIYVTGTRSD